MPIYTDDSYDIDEYEREGNNYESKDDRYTRVAVAEIKDVKSQVFDNYHILKCSRIGIICSLVIGVICLVLLTLLIAGITGGRSDCDHITSPSGPVGATLGNATWTPTSECREGWVGDEGWIADGQGLNMGCLLFVKTKMSWNVAKAWCEDKSARLVEIYNRAQHNFVKKKLLAFTLAEREYDSNFWTGATDEVNEGKIVWTSSGLDVKNEMDGLEWYQGSFAYSNDASDDYVALTKNSVQMYTFTGYLTTKTNTYHPICQIPP